MQTLFPALKLLSACLSSFVSFASLPLAMISLLYNLHYHRLLKKTFYLGVRRGATKDDGITVEQSFDWWLMTDTYLFPHTEPASVFKIEPRYHSW